MRMRCLAALSIAIMLWPANAVGANSGTICIAPLYKDTGPIRRSASGLFCESQNWSVKIDGRPRMTWSTDKSVRVDGLDTAALHRIVVFCNGKPQQSFKFRFSEFKATNLCLFLNDLYNTVQLWDPKRMPAPWCECKER